VYLLLDANVTAGYYLPRSLDSRRARGRIRVIFDSTRSHASSPVLYIPNFCVAEVFSVFAKHAFGKWNRHVKKKKGTIDKRVYKSLVRQFGSDIHNGAFLNQYELSRYHILGIDLVAPVDHHYQISRGTKKNHKPAGTFDHLIISMGIQLAHLHGPANVAIVTADRRIGRIVDRCRNGIPARIVRKLKLDRAQEVTGRPFSPNIFPQCLELSTCKNADLAALLGAWPLTIGNDLPAVYRWTYD